MGKQRRERRKPHKENPTGLPTVKDFEETEALNVPTEDPRASLEQIYEDIQSPNVEEKLNGLQSLEWLCTMPNVADLAARIAESGITKVLGPLLVDHSAVVRAAAATALRFMADSGRIDVYKYLLKDDIMTPLSALLKQYQIGWKPKKNQMENEKGNDDNHALVQAISLLWTLCENNEFAIKIANDEDLVSVLIQFVDTESYGTEIVTVVAQCLLSLSEDNPTAISKLREHKDTFADLLDIDISNISKAEIVSLRTPIAGLLTNLLSATDISSLSTICKVTAVLADTLSVDHKPILDSLVSILPHEKNAFSTSAKKKVRDGKSFLEAQQQALEILANLCSEDPDDQSQLGSDEEMAESDCEMEDEKNESLNCKFSGTMSLLPPEITEVLKNLEVVSKIWQMTKAVDNDIEEILMQDVEGKAILKQMHTMRCRAYLCLNNLLSSLEIDSFGGTETVYRMWMEMGRVVFKEANPNDIELLESATAAMRAALQRLSEGKANIFNRLTLLDVEPMLNGERQCCDANVRRNLIRMLGSLTLMLVNTNIVESSELIKHLTLFLLDTCGKESVAWVIAECLDVIMDVYSEDETDQLAKEVELVDKLQSLVSYFGTKVRHQKHEIGENTPVVLTVKTNIRRFIKYKGNRIRNLT